MKTDSKINYFFILTLIAGMIIGALVFSSCAKIPDAANDATSNVKVTLDYAFPHSGNITTKGLASSYLDFYTKYIESKLLTPRTYILLFTGHKGVDSLPSTGSTVYAGSVIQVIGKWGSNDLVSLPPDVYTVTGMSVPTQYDLAGDTCYLNFDDIITVTASTTSIVLKADYTCSLVLLDTTNVRGTSIVTERKVGYSTYKPTMLKTDGFYSTFVVANSNIDENHYQLDLKVTTKDGPVDIGLWSYHFTAGKYYYFGNTGSNYTLSQFTNGN